MNSNLVFSRCANWTLAVFISPSCTQLSVYRRGWSRFSSPAECSPTQVASCPSWKLCFGWSRVATFSASATVSQPSHSSHFSKRTSACWWGCCRGWACACRDWGLDMRPVRCLFAKYSSFVLTWSNCRLSTARSRPGPGGQPNISATLWKESPLTWPTSRFQVASFKR